MSLDDEVVPLARPVLGEEEERAVVEVLRSGQLSLGPRVPAFERAFAARLGIAHASAVSSGTAGLHLALRAVGVTDGDEVVTSPFSFVASANAVLFERARPVFADIDPVTLNLDPRAAAAAITERTSALLPVHIFGYPADLPAFEALGLPIVEDACEALGAVHADGTPVGGRGHPAVFGFYANKHLTHREGGRVAKELPIQMRADVTGLSVRRSEMAETTALGAAFAAGLAVGVWAGLDELRAISGDRRRWLAMGKVYAAPIFCGQYSPHSPGPEHQMTCNPKT